MSCKGRNWRADGEFTACTSVVLIIPRLALDAAISKNEKMKNSKKEKDRKDAEEELLKAQDR